MAQELPDGSAVTRVRPVKAGVNSLLLLAAFSMVVSVRAEEDRGQDVYLKWCSACHMDSPFAAGTIRLRYSRGKDRAVVTRRDDLSRDYIKVLVRRGMNGMPLFRRTEIDDTELDLLADYLATDR